MKYSFEQAVQLLERTPAVLDKLLRGLPVEWLRNNEGPDTFSPFDVTGHMLHGERTDWMARVEIILSDRHDKTFASWDRFAHYRESEGKTMDQLLDEFADVRAANIKTLRSKRIDEITLEKTGIHPVFGSVTLRQLMATWVVHDLSHLAQISRVMAKQYRDEVGPWIQYHPILTR